MLKEFIDKTHNDNIEKYLNYRDVITDNVNWNDCTENIAIAIFKAAKELDERDFENLFLDMKRITLMTEDRAYDALLEYTSIDYRALPQNGRYDIAVSIFLDDYQNFVYTEQNHHKAPKYCTDKLRPDYNLAIENKDNVTSARVVKRIYRAHNGKMADKIYNSVDDDVLEQDFYHQCQKMEGFYVASAKIVITLRDADAMYRDTQLAFYLSPKKFTPSGEQSPRDKVLIRKYLKNWGLLYEDNPDISKTDAISFLCEILQAGGSVSEDYHTYCNASAEKLKELGGLTIQKSVHPRIDEYLLLDHYLDVRCSTDSVANVQVLIDVIKNSLNISPKFCAKQIDPNLWRIGQSQEYGNIFLATRTNSYGVQAKLEGVLQMHNISNALIMTTAPDISFIRQPSNGNRIISISNYLVNSEKIIDIESMAAINSDRKRGFSSDFSKGFICGIYHEFSKMPAAVVKILVEEGPMSGAELLRRVGSKQKHISYLFRIKFKTKSGKMKYKYHKAWRTLIKCKNAMVSIDAPKEELVVIEI